MPIGDFLNQLFGTQVPGQYGGVPIDPVMQQLIQRQAMQNAAQALMNPIQLTPNGAGYIDLRPALGAGRATVEQSLPQARQFQLENEDRRRQAEMDELRKALINAQTKTAEARAKPKEEAVEDPGTRAEMIRRRNALAARLGFDPIPEGSLLPLDMIGDEIKSYTDELEQRGRPRDVDSGWQSFYDRDRGQWMSYNPDTGQVRPAATVPGAAPLPQDPLLSPSQFENAVDGIARQLVVSAGFLNKHRDLYLRNPAAYQQAAREEAMRILSKESIQNPFTGSGGSGGGSEAAATAQQIARDLRADNPNITRAEIIADFKKNGVTRFTEQDLASWGF